MEKMNKKWKNFRKEGIVNLNFNTNKDYGPKRISSGLSHKFLTL